MHAVPIFLLCFFGFNLTGVACEDRRPEISINEITTSTVTVSWHQGNYSKWKDDEELIVKIYEKEGNFSDTAYIIPQNVTEFDNLQSGTEYIVEVSSTSNVSDFLYKALLATAHCPDGWVGFRKSCYIRMVKNVRHSDAVQECQVLSPRAHLADPRTVDEYRFITGPQILPSGSWNRVYWIGIKVTSDGEPTYSDGKPVNNELNQFRGSDAEDNYECVALNPTGEWEWRRTQCVVNAHFICQYPVPMPPKDIHVYGDEAISMATWQSPQPSSQSRFTHYVVELREGSPISNATVLNELSPDMSRFYFGDLKSGYQYYLSICSKEENAGKSAKYPDILFVTDPPSVSVLKVQTTYSSLSIDWDVIDNENTTFHNFVVEYHETNGTSGLDKSVLLVEDFNATIVGLKPFTKYTVAVFSSVTYNTWYGNKTQRSISSDSSQQELQTNVSPIFNLRVDQVSLGEMQFDVEWNPAVGEIDEYNLYVEAQSGYQSFNYSIEKSRTRATVADLAPATRYIIQMNAAIDNTSSRSVQIEQTTRPRPLTNFQAIISKNKTIDSVSFEMSRSWTGNDNFDEYKVVFHDITNEEFFEKNFNRELKTITFHGLTPGSTYAVSLHTVKDGVLSVSWKDESVVLQVAPPENITVLSRDESSLILGWNTGAGDVTNFLVMCDHCPGEKKRVLDAEKEISYVINDLKPGSLYTFSIQAFIVLGSPSGATPPASDWVSYSVRTMPNAPGLVEVIASNSTSQTLEWLPVEGHNDGYIVEYFVAYQPQISTIPVDDGIIEIPRSDESKLLVTIDDLVPGITYQAEVSTVAGSTRSSPASVSMVTDASPLGDIHLAAIYEDSAEVFWDAGVGGFQSFELQVSEVSAGETTVYSGIQNSTFVIDSLKAGTLYHVTLVKIAYPRNSLPLEIEIQTRPSPVSKVEVYDVAENSFAVRWVPPKSPYTEFVVTLHDPNNENSKLSSKTVSVSYISFDKLEPGKKYSVVIESMISRDSTVGYGVKSEVTLYPLPPVGIISTGKTSTSLSASWMSPEGVIGSYIVTWQPGDGMTNTTEPEISIDGLVPGVAYTITVYSGSEDNLRTSRTGEDIIIYTDEDYPGPPSNVRLNWINTNSARLEWDEPEEPNGVILEYVFEYIQLYPASSWGGFATTEGAYASLVDLDPGAFYKVDVGSKNSKGMIPSSWADGFFIQTKEDLPGPVNQLTVEATEERSLNVSWKFPQSPNGEITLYRLSVSEQGSDEIIKTVNFHRDMSVHPLKCFDHDNRIVEEKFADFVPQNNTIDGPFFEASCDVTTRINNLRPYTTYQVTVRAFTAVGGGEVELAQHTTMEEVPSGPPRNITVTDSGPTFVKLSWEPPEFPNGLVMYSLNMFEEETITTSDTVYEITNLTAYHVIAVNFASRTNAGRSDSTPWLLLNTAEGVPSAPLSLNGKVMNSESVYLTWQQPNNPKGIVTSYDVSIYDDANRLVRVDVVDVGDTNITDIKPDLKAETALNDNIPIGNESLLYNFIGSKIPEFLHDTITHVAKDLKPYTRYRFEVNGVTSAGDGESAKIGFRTHEDRPGSSPTNLTYANLTSTAVYMNWLEPKDPNGEIISYSVMYISKLSEMRTKITNKTEVVLENLLKNSPYSVFVNSKTAAGEGPSSVRLQMYTEEDVPESPPFNLKYFNVTPTVIRLQWSPPKIPNGIIRYYTVYYRNNNGEFSLKSERPETHLTNLKVYGEYTIQIAASTKFGSGGLRSLPLYVRTGEGQPGSPPHNLTYENITSTTVNLNWHEPLEPNGVITHYEIHIESQNMDDDKNVTTPDASTDFLLDVLHPNSEYTISIRAHTKFGDGGQISIPLKIHTMEGAPGSPPANLIYENITSSSILLSWNDPEIPNGKLLGFKVYDHRGSSTQTDHSIEIDGLDPFSAYSIAVSALTAAGEGPNATISVYTEEDVPGSPPRDVNYTQISPTEVLLSWQPPLIPNGVIVEYMISYEGDHDFDILFTNTTNVLLAGLRKHANYTASVESRTKVGYGENKVAYLTFKTLQDAPSDPPQNVAASATGSTSIEVSWDPPTQPNGDIQRYTIYLEDDNDKVLVKQVFDGTSAIVDGLQKYSWYNITVTASTGLGDGGQISEMIRVQTHPGVPESGVGHFHVVNVTSNTVQLVWSAPNIKTGEFEYLLEWSADSGNEVSGFYIGDAPTMQYEIYNLLPFISYNVSITPKVRGVDGQGPTASLSFVTLESPPSHPVTDLKVLEVAHDEVTISWKPPPEPNGIIMSYIIDLNDELLMNFDLADWSGNDLLELGISNLHPNKMYKIEVTPVNSAGQGPVNELMINTTSGIPQDPPRNVKVTHIGEHETTLLWDAPLQTNGDVVSYKILYNKVDKNVTIGEESLKYTLEVDGSGRNATLYDLEAFADYAVTVASGTKYGYGPASNKTTFKTLEAKPSAPAVMCTALPDWNIRVSWLEPVRPNGIITRYSLQQVYPVGEAFEKYFNSSMSYVIPDVTPFTLYGVEVKAENGAGYSEAANCSVLAPEGTPSAPLSLSLVSATSTTITFEWKPPIQLNGVLSHYEIHYKPGFSCWANGGELHNPAEEKLCIVKTDQVSKTLLALQSYSEYAVRIGAVTGGGLGELTSQIRFKTETGVPDYPPRNVQAHMISSTAINVTWEAPHFFAGPTWYKAIAYFGDVMAAESDIDENEIFNVVIEGLKPDTIYSVAVFAETSAGSIESKKTVVTTDEDAPGDSPAKLQILTEDGNTSSVMVQFLPPKEPNGPLFLYTLEYKLGKDGDATSMDIFEEQLPYSDEAIMLQNVTITDLLGGRRYYFRMNAATLVGTGPWTNWTGPITLPVLAPPVLPVTLDVQQPEESQPQSTTTLQVNLCLFSEINGAISNVTVIVAEDGGELEVAPVYWFQAYEKNPSPPYLVLATEEYASLCHNGGIQKRSVASPSNNFVIGSDNQCIGKKAPYCNGPLKSDTAYRLKLRGTTSNGDYTDTEFSQPVKTHPTFIQANLYLLIGLIAGFGVLLFFLSVVIHHVRRRLRSRSLNEPQQSRHSSLNKRASSGGVKSPSPVDNLSFVMEATDPKSRKSVSRPVPKSSFVTHVARMSEHNDKGFLSEFEEISSVAPSGLKTIGSQSFNAGKNRFIDIVPYDHYRVKIEDISSIEGSGYINASYIPGAHSPEQYIATQSPLANTKNEFWRMVWETGCQTLIMLCNVEQDGNEEKISKYWPNLTQTSYYGNLGVQCSLEEKKPEWTVRTFIVAKRDQRRQVTQYHFTLWPLRGVPDNPQPFIRFFQATRRSVRSSAGQPIIVMCSSGSGRSGVFIAYDMIVDALAKENTVDPCGVVSELRNYRPLMVQTVVEYSFLHRCLAYSISKCSVRSPTGDGMEETTMF